LTRALTEACWQGVGGKPCGLKAETRSIVIRAQVSEIGNERIVIHPNDDPLQAITIPAEDVLVFGGDMRASRNRRCIANNKGSPEAS
jgi:hypothetical protein